MARIQAARLGKESNVTRSDGTVLRSAIEQLWNDREPVVLDFGGRESHPCRPSTRESDSSQMRMVAKQSRSTCASKISIRAIATSERTYRGFESRPLPLIFPIHFSRSRCHRIVAAHRLRKIQKSNRFAK